MLVSGCTHVHVIIEHLLLFLHTVAYYINTWVKRIGFDQNSILHTWTHYTLLFMYMYMYMHSCPFCMYGHIITQLLFMYIHICTCTVHVPYSTCIHIHSACMHITHLLCMYVYIHEHVCTCTCIYSTCTCTWCNVLLICNFRIQHRIREEENMLSASFSH